MACVKPINISIYDFPRVLDGGASLFDAGCGIPPGGLEFNSSAWFETVRHAADGVLRSGSVSRAGILPQVTGRIVRNVKGEK